MVFKTVILGRVGCTGSCENGHLTLYAATVGSVQLKFPFIYIVKLSDYVVQLKKLTGLSRLSMYYS
jgi:hypothetical protein